MVEKEAMASEALRPKIKRRNGVWSLSTDIRIITMMVNDAMNDVELETIPMLARISAVCRKEGMLNCSVLYCTCIEDGSGRGGMVV